MSNALVPQSELLDLWRQFGECRRGLALSRQQRAALRARLGELLDLQQAACRSRGQEGHFLAWLQANHIAPSTAYRLIETHRHPHKPFAFIRTLARTCLSGNVVPKPPAPAPGWQIRGHFITVQLSPRQAELVRRSLAAHPASASPSTVEALLDTLHGLLRSRSTRPDPHPY